MAGEAQRRGAAALRRGKDWEREVVHILRDAFPDVKRTGMEGGPDDVLSSELYVQCKKDKALYPKRLDALLSEIEQSADPDLYPALALASPGRGHHKLVVMDIRDLVYLILDIQEDALKGSSA